MKQPKLPKGVCFIDEDGFKIAKKKGWKSLQNPEQEIVVRVAARGIPRKFVFRHGEVVRVLFGKKDEVPLDNYVSLGKEFEEALDDFVACAIIWAKEMRQKRERRATAWRRLRIFPETNRVMHPTRFARSPGQSRLF